MFELQFRVSDCISCGICMDVCAPRAISMRTKSARSVEGPQLTFLYLEPSDQSAYRIERLMTFPYMSAPELCDGCRLCVLECPGNALELSISDLIPGP